jgi:hypothetical protein
VTRLQTDGYSPAYDASVTAGDAVMSRFISLTLTTGRGKICTANFEEVLLLTAREQATRRGVVFIRDPRGLDLTPKALAGTLTRMLARAAA